MSTRMKRGARARYLAASADSRYHLQPGEVVMYDEPTGRYFFLFDDEALNSDIPESYWAVAPAKLDHLPT